MTVGYVITWDGSPSSSMPEVIFQKVSRRMIGTVRDAVVSLPGRDGSWLFEERRGNRDISVQGLIHGAPDLRHDLVVELAEWLDKTGYRRLYFSDQPDRYWLASVSEDPDPDEWKSLGRFTLNWTAEPYSYAVSTSQDCTATALDGTPYILVVPDTVDAYPIVELTARGGSANNIQLTVGDDTLAVSEDFTLADGETLTINSLNYTVTAGINEDIELTGAWVPGTVLVAEVMGGFPFLVEGSNQWNVLWDGTATRFEVCYTWRRRYR